MDEVFTLQEVAEKLKVSIQSITKIVKSGKLKSVLVGRQYRITETFLEEYVNGIFGDKPVEQGRAVNPSEKVDRKPNTRGRKVSQEVATEPTADNDLVAYVHHEDEAEPIELILKLKAEGVSYRGIAENLNSLGIKTDKGKEWTHATVDNNIRKHKKLTNG